MRRRQELQETRAANQWMLPYWLKTQEEFLKTRPFGIYVPATAKTRINKLFAVKGQRFPNGYNTRAIRRKQKLDSNG